MLIFILVPLIMVAHCLYRWERSFYTKICLMFFNIPYFYTFNRLAAVPIICLVIAYPVAFTLTRMTKKVQSTMLMVVMLPMWMNFLLRTYAWMTLLGNNGLVNKIFGLIGLGPFKMLNTEGAVVLGMVYNYLPFMILPLYSVMVKIEKNILEAASDLGCSSRLTLFKVVLPLSLPGVTSGITMVFVCTHIHYFRMYGGGNSIGDLIEMQFLGNPII